MTVPRNNDRHFHSGAKKNIVNKTQRGFITLNTNTRHVKVFFYLLINSMHSSYSKIAIFLLLLDEIVALSNRIKFKKAHNVLINLVFSRLKWFFFFPVKFQNNTLCIYFNYVVQLFYYNCILPFCHNC